MKKEARQPELSDYLFVASRIEYGTYTVEARQIFDALAAAGRWFLPSYASFRAVMGENDRVIFYLGGPRARQFVGDAVLASRPRPLAADDRAVLRRLQLTDFDLAVDLSSLNVWKVPVPISPLVAELAFIKDKRYPGQYLRHGVVRLGPSDFDTLTDAARLVAGRSASRRP